MSESKLLKDQLVSLVTEGGLSPDDAMARMNALTPKQAQIGRVYTPTTIDQRIAQYEHARAIRGEIRDQKVPFITPQFLKDFYLSQGLIVVGAESGKAKSTTCGNVLAGFLRASRRNAIVISNEEATDAVYERAACVLEGVSFQELTLGKAGRDASERVYRRVVKDIIPRCEIVEEGDFDMSYLEDVQAVMEASVAHNVGLVAIDYLQVITQSRKAPELEAFQISKRLGFYLKSFGKQHAIPVVCFVQLNGQGDSKSMAERVQNDKTFYNHAFAAIEVKPDFETLTTTFKIHKDRFNGCSGKEVVMGFDGGAYVVQF